MSLSVREQEYLEAMYFLLREKGIIRVRDLAQKLGVRPASVVDALERLEEKGLVTYRKRERISLTENGIRAASEIAERHELLKRFFIEVLGVPEDVAEQDACYLEHGVHPQTLDRIFMFLKFISMCPRDGPDLLEQFKYFAKYEKCPSD